MKYILRGIGVILILFALIQLVPYGRDHTNPPETTTPRWDTTQTQMAFERTCADCHSNVTIWPWYSNIAPMSWLVQHDVEEGRAAFNISVPNGTEEAGESAETVENGEMPPRAYLFLHPTANLNAAEQRLLEQGLTATFGAETEGRESGKR